MRKRKEHCASPVFVVSFLALVLSGRVVGAVPAAELTAAQRQTVERAEKLLAANPQHGGSMFRLAQVYASAGQVDNATSWLSRALATGIGVDVEGNAAFDPIRNPATFRALAARAAASAAPLVASTRALRLKEQDLEPEGIAYDPVEKSFYLGSIKKRKIVRVAADGGVSDFVTAGRDDLYGVVGLRVDGKRRHLWANAYLAEGGTDAGRSGLFQYDLASGRLLNKFLVGSATDKHLFNDLVVGADGAVFLTDSETGRIYTLRPGASALEAFAGANGEFRYPNGLAFDATLSKLYVADFLHGISLLDIAARRMVPLAHDAGVATYGIDGLYLFEGSLIAIQNSNGIERILRFDLDASGQRITAARVLERGNKQYTAPMTGAVVDRELYFVANGVTPAGSPQDTVVHRLPIP